MAERRVCIHAFASVKGGVGKSSLAIACAKLLVEQGSKPVLVDGDMFGTSIADGLDLCAPEVKLDAGGRPDLHEPPTGKHYTLEETRRRRGLRRDAPVDVKLPPVFLNDILEDFDEQFAKEGYVKAPCIDALLWRHENDDGVAYLPSSPLREAVAESLGWIRIHEQDRYFDDWVHCLAWTFEALLHQREDITDIVVDLPPGTIGLTHQLLVLLSYLETHQPNRAMPVGYPSWNANGIAVIVNPFLISSADRNDMLPALEYLGQNQKKVPSLRLLVNRVALGTDIEALRASGRNMLGPALGALGIEQDMHKVDEYRETLGIIFKAGDLRVDDKIRALREVLRLGGRSS
jgi:hypothetical protein